MNMEKLRIPHTRDPFVNTPLINAGFDPDSGEERFWISTWNSNVGCLGALVTPSGKSRIYRFEKQDGLIGCGAYSACLTDNDTLWLISDLQAFVKLTLSTGEYEVYRTGAPSALVFAGIQYDKATNKLFAGAFVPPDQHAVSFDINTKTAKIFNNFTKASTMRGGFPIGDGTYGFCVLLNECAVYRWDPVTDTVSKLDDFFCSNHNYMTTIACDSQGRHYIHGKGWLDKDGCFDATAIADKELLFFGCVGDTVYGTCENLTNTDVYAWNTKSGEIKKLFTERDNSKYNLTTDGRIIGVSLYGELTLHTLEGEKLFSKSLDASAPNCADCIIRINDELLLGTPFISQRFWLLNTKTREEIDAGRASPGGGEVLKAWALNGKGYMASYTQGVLTEFDPEKPINFPDNPKILCQPKNSMRPIADANIGDEIFYSSTHPYGELGCEITKYNLRTHEATYMDDPIPGHALASMCVTPDKKLIISSTTYEGDCGTAPPISDECFIVELCPETLDILYKVKVPVDCCRAVVVGIIDAEHMLCELHMPNAGKRIGVYDYKARRIEVLEDQLSSSAQLLHTGKDNLFVMLDKGKVCLAELCDDALKICTELLHDKEIYRIFVCKGEIYAISPVDIYIISEAF